MAAAAALPIVAVIPTAAPAFSLTATDPMFAAIANAAADSTTDAELHGLVEQLFVAEAEACRLNRIWDQMPETNRKPLAALKIQESDADLRIPKMDRPANLSKTFEFYCGAEVDRMREPKWQDRAGSNFVRDENMATVTVRYFTPSTAARARADEIIAAYDKSKNRKSRAYRAAERAKDKAFEISGDLIDQIAEIKATSVQGLAAKARCVELIGLGEDDITRSILADLLAMAGKSAA